jgi:hypothetical protein
MTATRNAHTPRVTRTEVPPFVSKTQQNLANSAAWGAGWSGREAVRSNPAPAWAAPEPVAAPDPVENSTTYTSVTVAVPRRVLAYMGGLLLFLVFVLGVVADHTAFGGPSAAQVARDKATATDTTATAPGAHRAPTVDETGALAKARQATHSDACWFEWEGSQYGVYDIICDTHGAGAAPSTN